MNKEEAINRLKEEIKEGDTLWTQLNHVSKSGWTRHISVKCLKQTDSGECYPYDFTHLVSKATGWNTGNRHDGVRMQGCGQDMGFHLINTLSYILFDDGYAIKHRWL